MHKCLVSAECLRISKTVKNRAPRPGREVPSYVARGSEAYFLATFEVVNGDLSPISTELFCTGPIRNDVRHVQVDVLAVPPYSQAPRIIVVQVLVKAASPIDPSPDHVDVQNRPMSPELIPDPPNGESLIRDRPV